MAKYNEILSGRFNRFVLKYFSMKGPAPSPQVSGDIAVTMNLPFGVEERFLFSYDTFAREFPFGAVAGQVTGIRLRNPAGSNVVLAVTKIHLSVNTTGDEPIVSFGASTTDLATPQVAPSLDSRIGRAGSTAQLSSTQAAAITALSSTIWESLMGATSSADAILFENQEIPVLPGSAIQLQTSLVNNACTLGIWWRERALEDSEGK